jgi:prephenate dehydratase
MILIGYQGILNSNSEEAAKEFAKKFVNEEYILLPLVSSFNVLDNVNNGNIDYGVVAYENNNGGKVTETVKTIDHLNLDLVQEVVLPIHHFLFVKNNSVLLSDISKIASHSQALIQCQNNLKNSFPNVILVNDEDTATAARKLNLGLFDENTAVICRLNAGFDNGLHLLKSNLEDNKNNKTMFRIYKKTI